MSQSPFSDEEIARLRNLLAYEEIISEQAQYRAAQRIVLRTWRGLIIGIAAVIAALATFYAGAQATIRHFVTGG